MIKYQSLQIGDSSDNGQVIIVDEDRLCYLVKNTSKGSVGIRTISKKLLDEYVDYYREHPDESANTARDYLCGKTDVDKFEYGYSSTLAIMAKMVITGTKKTSINVFEKYPHKKSVDNLQQIFYGAPGTGKSNTIKEVVDDKHLSHERTTFHPDSDYSTFVGAYKPTTKQIPMRDVTGKVIKENGADVTEDRIVYEFVPQAFLKAYTSAWKDLDKPFFLIIEEINRGNCAQIFGDLFQLLDRKDSGFSDYPIKADADIKRYLQKAFNGLSIEQTDKINSLYNGRNVVEQVLAGDILLLPNNLFIWATMNTSDQSLFPIDSAFKRRWDWKYVPISNAKKGWKIEANGMLYDWWQFLQKINDKIETATYSEDKKLGYFFCKAKDGIIDAETFVGKVLFYLWNDVFKDNSFDDDKTLFTDEDGLLSFHKFYTVGDDGKTKVREEKVERFLQNLGVEPMEDENENNGRAGFNVSGKFVKTLSETGVTIITDYIESHPMTFNEIKEMFPDSLLGSQIFAGLIVRNDANLGSYSRYYQKKLTSSDGIEFKICKGWTKHSIDNIINFANAHEISVEEVVDE